MTRKKLGVDTVDLDKVEQRENRWDRQPTAAIITSWLAAAAEKL